MKSYPIEKHPPRQKRCQRGHEFTAENTYVSPGRGDRMCLACIRLRRITTVEPTQDLTCPDCGETRTIRARQRYPKKYPAEVCQPCSSRRSASERFGPKPSPLPIEVMVADDDWRLPEERLSARETWLRMSVAEQREFRAAMRWLPTPNQERSAA